MSSSTKMQAPKGTTSAVIDGNKYKIPKDGVITLVNEDHLPILLRHGFTVVDEDTSPEALEAMIEDMDDKDKLVEFIEERGGEADNSMGFKKLKRLAREAIAQTDEDED